MTKVTATAFQIERGKCFEFSFTPTIAATTDWTGSNKLANLWYYGIEPAAYVEVTSNYKPAHLQLQLISNMDHNKEQQLAGQEINKIITQAALEHEIKKQQWFLQAQHNEDHSKVKVNKKLQSKCALRP